MTSMDLNALIKDAEKYYSDEWGASSIGYSERGFYEWCLGKIQNRNDVFEIGSGIGISTQKIIQSSKRVTAIEENIFNYEKTISRLRESNILFGSTDRYKGEKFQKTSNNIILGNYLTDKKLHSEIISELRIDAIICWFMGAHPATHAKKELQAIGYVERHPPTYRDFVYDKIFEETARYLQNDGIINLIERSEIFKNDDVKEEHVRNFSEYYRLKNYNLVVVDVDQLPTENIDSLPGIKMQAYDGDELVAADAQRRKHGLLSMTIGKRK
jgi:hypothetical protein